MSSNKLINIKNVIHVNLIKKNNIFILKKKNLNNKVNLKLNNLKKLNIISYNKKNKNNLLIKFNFYENSIIFKTPKI